ncbi:MAG: hypothetical protein AAF266_03335 [Planctomycetota bacterium]
MHAQLRTYRPKPESFQLYRRDAKEPGLAVAGQNYWWRLGRKIALLSAHSSVVGAVLSIPLQFVFLADAGAFDPVWMGAMFGFMLLGIPLGWLASFLYNGLLALVLLPLVSVAQKWLGTTVPRDTTGWVAGSTVAIVGTAGGAFHYQSMQVMPTVGLAVMFMGTQVVGSMLVIAAGQCGGYLGSLKALRHRRARPTERVKFGLWQMLAATSIIAVLLSVARFAGSFATPLVVSVSLCTVTAWAVHRPVACATNRWLDWLVERRTARRMNERLYQEASKIAT